MRYLALAADYDGTLATHGKVEPETVDALQRLKAATRKLILVTGHELHELMAIFPEYTLFDRIVAENGALVFNPVTKEEKLLGDVPPASFIEDLKRRNVHPMSVGKVIVATWEPNHTAVLEAIKEAGLELQVIFNKGAVMILPAGINKAKGLKAALKELNISMHNVVAVGDAENDGAMLQAAECAVAVSNALPALKEMADWVTTLPQGKGVVQLINAMVENDLAALSNNLTRHFLPLGATTSGEPFLVNPHGHGILLSGTTKSGKTTLATYILEQLLDKNYQFCLIDPEGDYVDMSHVVKTGDSNHAPTIEEVLSLLQSPTQSVVVCILAISLEDRPAFFNNLISALAQMRKETGHPHWIIGDEGHHMLPAPAASTFFALPGDFNNFLFITTSPEVMNESILCKTSILISTGDDAANAIHCLSNMQSISLPDNSVKPLEKGQAWVWQTNSGQAPFLINTGKPSHFLQRHKKKYATGNMDYNSFYFRGPDDKMNLKAYNLMIFTQMAEGIDSATWMYHLKRNDYSNWIENAVHDHELATAVKQIEEKDIAATASRQAIVDIINERYTG